MLSRIGMNRRKGTYNCQIVLKERRETIFKGVHVESKADSRDAMGNVVWWQRGCVQWEDVDYEEVCDLFRICLLIVDQIRDEHERMTLCKHVIRFNIVALLNECYCMNGKKERSATPRFVRSLNYQTISSMKDDHKVWRKIAGSEKQGYPLVVVQAVISIQRFWYYNHNRLLPSELTYRLRNASEKRGWGGGKEVSFTVVWRWQRGVPVDFREVISERRRKAY